MKKLILSLFLASFGLVFAQTITFNKTEYELCRSYEFDDEQTLQDEWMGTFLNYDLSDPEKYKIELPKVLDNVVSYTVNADGSRYVKDGVLHLIERHWIDKDGLLHLSRGEIRSQKSFYDYGGDIKSPFTFNEGLIEIKFKMPYDPGTSFAMFVWADEADVNGKTLDKTYSMTEVDFAELIAMSDTCVHPHGGFHVRYNPTNTQVTGGGEHETNEKPIRSKEWYDQWHVLQAKWDHKSLSIYYDGVLFRKIRLNLSYINSNKDGKFGLFIRPEYCGNFHPVDIDYNDDSAHDFQVDYVRIYSEVK